MALQISQQPTAYDRPYPKIGCGIIFCFEEDDFIITPGEASNIDIVLNLFSLVSDGDTMTLHGFDFTFVTASPTHLQEVQIAALDGTATNLYDSLLQIPFFIDNYNISNPAYQVILLAKELEFDDNYEFTSNTANVDAVALNPFATQTAGANPVTKDDYYVLFDVLDVDSNEKLCGRPIAKPINVPASGNPNVCLDFQALIESYPKIATSSPAPFSPTATAPNKIAAFDYSYLRNFNFRIWNKFLDPNSPEPCKKIQTNFYELPESSQLITIANFVQNANDCEENGFNDYSFNPAVLPQKFITNMPESYKICQDTAVELRFDYPVELIDSIGGDTFIGLTLNFTDGTSTVTFVEWDVFEDGVHIAYLSFGDGSGNETVTIPAGKKLSNVVVEVIHIIFATIFQPLEIKTIYFNNDGNAYVKCCEPHKTFYFLGQRGNNDVIVGKDISIDFEAEFFTFCKEQKCCGTENNGVKNYNTGQVNAGVEKNAKIHKALIEADGDYLEQFLLAPTKWEYEPETDSIYLITPTKNSFTIWSKNKRNLIEFTYKRTLIKRHFQL